MEMVQEETEGGGSGRSNTSVIGKSTERSSDALWAGTAACSCCSGMKNTRVDSRPLGLSQSLMYTSGPATKISLPTKKKRNHMSCVCVCINGEIELFIKNIFFR